MRVNPLLFLFILVLVCTKGYGQITLHTKKMPLEKVLGYIQKQTGYTFFYDSEDVEGRVVNINVVNVSLYQALSACLQDTPIAFEVVNKTVILTRKERSQATDTLSYDINGEIINFSTGQPIPYASIKVLNSRKGTSANVSGKFQLAGVRRRDEIEIRSLGFEKVVLPLSRLISGLKPGDTVTINEASVLLTKAQSYKIGLKPATTSLDEAIIVAYGTTTHRYDVGSVSVVKANEIEQHPVSNILQALQGLVPGLNITVTSGGPAASVFAQVRGQNTLLSYPGPNGLPDGYNQPLYIIDGVPFSIQTNQITDPSLNTLSEMTGSFFNIIARLSPLNTLNPADIESVSVLKDADATSIYGSQGSNGVILISTKRGKAGRNIFDISVNDGITKATRTPQMMNTTQYLSMRDEADRNSAHIPNMASDADLTIYDPTKYTNFSKAFFGATAHQTDIHLSLSGGSESTTYFISGGSTLQHYNFPGDFADKRLTLHTSFTYKSKDNKLNVDFGTDYSYETNNSVHTPSVTNAFTLAPNTPDLIDPNGNFVWSYKGFELNPTTPQGNPFAVLGQLSNISLKNINTHLHISYQLLPMLKLLVDGGYNEITDDNHFIVPISSQEPSRNPSGLADFNHDYHEMISLAPQLNFVKKIDKGNLSVLLGGTYWKNDENENTVLGFGYTSDALLNSVNGASATLPVNYSSIYKYVAVFSRINYIWDGKYIVNLTGNRNGSSNFGPDRKFGNFGSVGLGWIVSEESFVKETLPFLSYFKISGNYGTSGSDGIAPYNYQAYWQHQLSYPYQGFSGYTPVNPENPTYGWAINKKFNESLDFGFLKNRVVLNLTAYQNKASDQLVQYAEPATTGFPNIVANAPYTVQNIGFEFSITSKNIDSDFKWTTNFNISHNANKLTDFPGLASSPYAGYYLLGQPVGGLFVVPLVGVNPVTGVFNYRKKDGTIVSDPDTSPAVNGLGGDATEYIDLQPKFTGGFNNIFSYRCFSLSVFFQFAKQIGSNYKYSLYSQSSSRPGNPYFNLPIQLLSRWQKPGDVSEFQRLIGGIYLPVDDKATVAAADYAYSSGAYSDASYIRLKNLAFAYTLPLSLLKKVFVKDCTFYINAENLITITGYKVGDPETQTIYEVPLQRIIVAGVKLNF